MTQKQRENLFQILGRIEGLAWGVDNSGIADGFCGVVEDLARLLQEDAEQSEMTGEAFIYRFLKEGAKDEN